MADFAPSESLLDAMEPTPIEVRSDTQPTAKKPKQIKPSKVKDKPKKTLASINKSSLEELSSVKGMPKKLAKEIVDKRPHKTWDSLLKLKGMGPKLLKKLSEALKLN